MADSDPRDWHAVQGRSSYVWQFFERRRMCKASESGKSFSEYEHRCCVFYQNADGSLQRCFKIKQTSDTSNLHAHLLKEHGISKDNFTSKLGLLVEETAREILHVDSGIPGLGKEPVHKGLLDRSFSSTDTLHACIASLAAKHALPLSIFESSSFDAVLRSAKKHKGSHIEPRLVAGKVNEIAKWTEEAITLRVSEMEFVSLSFDRGTDAATRGLVTFCLHTIEDLMFTGDPEPDWIMREIQLDTVQLAEDVTEEDVAAYTSQVLRKYNLTDRLVALVSDKTGNLERVLKTLRDTQIEPPGDDSQVRLATVCHANGIVHAMQLCVTSALAQERPTMIVNNVFSLVDGCRKLNLLTRDIGKLTEAVGLAYAEVSFVGTIRFHVLHDMLEAFLRVYPHLVSMTTTPAGKLLADLVPSDTERGEIEEMVAMLRVVKERMAALGSTSFTTLGHCAVAMFAIARTMGEFERKGRMEFVRSMAQVIRQEIQGFLEPGDGLGGVAPPGQLRLMALAAGLHPLLKDSCVFQPDRKRALEWSQTVRELLITAVKQTEHLWPRPPGPLGRPVSPPIKRQYVSREKDITHAQFVEDLKHTGAIAMDADSMPTAPTVGIAYTEMDEVDEYMELRSDEFARDDFSLLKFWAMMAHTHRFPRLARLARRILCVPASTAGVERALGLVKRHLPNLADPNDGPAINALLLVSRNDLVAE